MNPHPKSTGKLILRTVWYWLGLQKYSLVENGRGNNPAAKVVKKVRKCLGEYDRRVLGPHNPQLRRLHFLSASCLLTHNPDHNHSAQSPADACGAGGAAQEEGVAGAQVPLGVPPAQLGILGCTGLQASRETRSGSGGEAHHPPEAQGLNTSVTCHLLFISVSDISYIITDHIFSLVSLTVSILWKGCRRSRCAVSTCLQIQTPTRPSSQYKDFVVFLIKNQLYFSTVTGCIYPRYQGERRQCYFQGSFWVVWQMLVCWQMVLSLVTSCISHWKPVVLLIENQLYFSSRECLGGLANVGLLAADTF